MRSAGDAQAAGSATLLTKFEDIVKAGTKVVDSNISASQLGSFVDLAMKSKGQP